MVLTISTNTAALNVQRNLNEANEASASSLAKLSSGSRVPTAKDDAASLAIGSRVEAEIAGLKQASINASQATSLLQIADGAYGEINDILIRQESLAIQSASGQLSDTERAIIDSEFTNLTSEIDRIANDTEFNGNKLLAGGDTIVTTNETVNGGLANKGIEVSYDPSVSDSGDGFSVEYKYDAGTPSNTLKLTNTTTGEVIEKDIQELMTAATGDATTGNLAAGQTLDVNFADAGITITLTDDFDRDASFGVNETEVATGGTASLVLGTDSEVKLESGGAAILGASSDTNDAGKLELSFLASGNVTSADTNLSFSIDGGTTWVAGGGAGVALAADAELMIGDASNGNALLATVNVGSAANGFTAATGVDDKLTLDLSSTFTNTETTSTTSTFDFKIGTGTVTSEDDLQVTVNGATSTVLGTNASRVDTQANANSAIDTVKSAIDSLQGSRANVGASLSRLDFASSNISVAIENQSAAKSGLMDVDMASETTTYAAQQVIVQAGVSLLAQANQRPSQLTSLIG
jgi:flagellin